MRTGSFFSSKISGIRSKSRRYQGKLSTKISDGKRRSETVTLILLAIPSLIEHILETLMQYVDTAMVGHLGKDATAAVSTTTTISWLVGTFSWSVGMAFMALIARAYGAREYDKVKRYTGFAFLSALIFGMFTALVSCSLSPFIPGWMKADTSIRHDASLYFFIISLPYVFRSVNYVMSSAIRAIKDTKTPMIINLGANILNVILNIILIFVMGLGVKGAAIASAVSSVIAGILMFVAVMRKDVLKFRARDMRPDKAMIGAACRIGLPAMATGTASCLGYVFFARMVSGMGKTIFAAHSIALSAEELFYIPGYGLRTATSSLIGNALGEKDEVKLKRTERASVFVNLSIMCVSAVLLFCLALPIMYIFTRNSEVAQIGSQVLRLVAFSEPFFGLMVVFEGIFYGKGQTLRVFFIETFCMWFIRLPLTYITINYLGLGLNEVWLCMIADNVCKAMALAICYLLTRKRGLNK